MTAAWVNTVIAEQEKGNNAGVAAALLPRLALLKDSKVTQDQSKAGDNVHGLGEIALRCPRIFAIKPVVDECVKLLAWSSGLSAPRDGIVQHQLACSLLLAGHRNLDLWPTSLVKAYLDDALQGRRWVDIQQASALVANIITAFPGTPDCPTTPSDKDKVGVGKEPDPKRRKMTGGSASADTLGAVRPGTSVYAEDEGCEDGEKATFVRPRYRSAVMQREIANMVLEAVKKNLEPMPSGESMQRKQQNFLRVLVLLVVYEPVRYEVMKRLEGWVNNPNLVRHLKELMPRLASQCTLSTEMETETVRVMLRMRPKANATQMHNEALGVLCKSNRGFPLRAFFTLFENEMKEYDSFAHKNNKSLKNSQYISTILKCSGVAHLTVDRPPELGSSVERFNVTDLGLGKLDYDIEVPLKLWASVMSMGTSKASASGVVLVATEEEACVGDAEQQRASRVEAAAMRAQEAGAAGLVIILATGSQRAMGPRTWEEGNIDIPVLGILPGEDVSTLMEAINCNLNGSLSRAPRETLLANCIHVFADAGDKRAGLSLLLRKMLKTCQMSAVPELDLVALSIAIMTPGNNIDALDNESKCLWALALVDVVCFICMHLASQVVEAGQASVHADRGVGGHETRAERAAVRMRGQVMRIVEAILDSWVPKVLCHFLPAERLNLAIRKMLFYEEASAYSVEPLILETHERQGVKILQNEMGVTETSLIALARLGLRSKTGFRAMDQTMVLELIERLVRRAVPLASRLAAPSSSSRTLSKSNLVISVDGVCLWEMLMDLARSCGEDAGHAHLAPQARVWQAYLVVVILGVFNTATIGALAWKKSPTLRTMMQMLITASFTFPPADGNPLAGLLAMEAEATRKEAHVVEQQRSVLLANNVAQAPRWLEKATLLHPTDVARCPPKDTLIMLKFLDKSHDLGNLLRASRQPNMLLETIMAHGDDSSACVGWLGAILQRYPQTANALPVVTICQLLLVNLAAAPASSLQAYLEPADSRSASILRLAMRLAECTHDRHAGGGEGESEEWEGVLFFLDLLGDENEHRRRMAVVALGLVLSCLEKVGKASGLNSETLPMSSSVAGDADSGEEEELLAGGGGEDEEELLAGGGGAQVEMVAGGGRSGGGGGSSNGVSLEEGSGEEGVVGVRVLWLQRLVAMENAPAGVHETLGLRLRGALKTETEVQLLLQYLEYLSQVARVSASALARDVALLVLRRRVLVQHLSKLPGATCVLTRVLLAGLTTRDEQAASATKSGDDELVKVPGSSVRAPLEVLNTHTHARTHTHTHT